MLAAGMTLPAPSPTQRFRQRWNHILDDNDQQTLLQPDPWMGPQVAPPQERRLVPRPDWAPPMVIPANTVNLFAAGVEAGAWAVTAVQGGDRLKDATAARLLDSGGPLTQGARDAHRELRATLTAVQAALSLTLANLAGADPLLLRVDEGHLRYAAGMVPPPKGCEDLDREMRALWTHVRRTRPVWLAGWRQGRLYWWGDRAVTLASQCANGSWGPQPPAWTAAPPVASLAGATAADGQCPVCLQDFSDPLPAPRASTHQGPNLARSSDVFHACPGAHAACVQCDRQLARLPQPRCTICRRDRVAWATLLP